MGKVNSTRLIFHPDHALHETGPDHPERPWRVDGTLEHLRSTPFWNRLEVIRPDPADRTRIERVHSSEHVSRIAAACRERVPYLDPDTPITQDSYRAALLASGGGLAAADAVISGGAANALVLARPPGHHAEATRAMGFCLFNHVAVTARYLQEEHHLGKIFIVDWDVHHGNGTQQIFEEDPTVFTFSVHQWPLYPGTGRSEEIGRGKGRGTVCNVPLEAGQGDKRYDQIFRERVGPAIEAYRPDAVLISAGFDAHLRDPLAGMVVTEEGFAGLTRQVTRWSSELCGGRVISFLEGGYDPQALPRSVEAHLKALLEAGS